MIRPEGITSKSRGAEIKGLIVKIGHAQAEAAVQVMGGGAAV